MVRRKPTAQAARWLRGVGGVHRCVPWLLVLSLGCEGTIALDRGGPPPVPRIDAGSTGDAALPPPTDAGPARDAGPRPPPPVDSGPEEIRLDGGPPEDITAAEQDLLDAINDERRGQGLEPVSIDARLLCAARRHALDVGGSGACGHVGSDGTWPWDRAEACGFPQDSWTVNEIAAGPGFRDGADAVWGWSNSSGHYAALTHVRARTVGVAVHNTCFIALFDCCVAGSE